MNKVYMKIEQEMIRIQRMADKEKNPLTRASYVGMYVAYSNCLKAIKDELDQSQMDMESGRD